jgi:hypothetical protein
VGKHEGSLAAQTGRDVDNNNNTHTPKEVDWHRLSSRM